MADQGPILIVEDDPDDREILTEALEELGVLNELKFYGDGQALLNYLRVTSDKPYIIITDVNLPGMDGKELARQICADEYLRLKSIPLVFLTTTADPKAVKEAYQLMVQGYFQKETDFAEIKNTLKLILDYWAKCRHPNNM